MIWKANHSHDQTKATCRNSLQQILIHKPFSKKKIIINLTNIHIPNYIHNIHVCMANADMYIVIIDWLKYKRPNFMENPTNKVPQ